MIWLYERGEGTMTLETRFNREFKTYELIWLRAGAGRKPAGGSGEKSSSVDSQSKRSGMASNDFGGTITGA